MMELHWLHPTDNVYLAVRQDDTVLGTVTLEADSNSLGAWSAVSSTRYATLDDAQKAMQAMYDREAVEQIYLNYVQDSPQPQVIKPDRTAELEAECARLETERSRLLVMLSSLRAALGPFADYYEEQLDYYEEQRDYPARWLYGSLTIGHFRTALEVWKESGSRESEHA